MSAYIAESAFFTISIISLPLPDATPTALDISIKISELRLTSSSLTADIIWSASPSCYMNTRTVHILTFSYIDFQLF